MPPCEHRASLGNLTGRLFGFASRENPPRFVFIEPFPGRVPGVRNRFSFRSLARTDSIYFFPFPTPGLRALRYFAGALIAAMALAAGGVVLAQSGQDGQDETIFNRFAESRRRPKFRQILLEIPVALRPQTQPDAEILKNQGLNIVDSLRPQHRFFISRSIGLARMEWAPKPAEVERVKVKTLDISTIFNFNLKGPLLLHMGFGLGFMDGLVIFSDERNFETRLEFFIPLQVGISLALGEAFQVGVKFVHYNFFRTDPVISLGRALIGFGFNF